MTTQTSVPVHGANEAVIRCGSDSRPVHSANEAVIRCSVVPASRLKSMNAF